MRTVKLSAASLLFGAAVSAVAQSPVRRPLESPELDVLREVIRSRGSRVWQHDEMIMTPTAPPISPPSVLPEWARASHVIFAFDSGLLSSMHLNQKLGTTDSKSALLLGDPDIREKVAAELCSFRSAANVQEMQSEEAADDIQVRAEEYKRVCPGGKASPSIVRATLDRLAVVHDVLGLLMRVSEHMPVLLLINGDSRTEDRLGDFRASLARFEAGAALLRRSNLRYLQVRLDSKWVRDYGPFFAVTGDGQVVCIDPRYDREAGSVDGTGEALRSLVAAKVGADLNRSSAGERLLRALGAVDPARSARRARQGDELVASELSLRLRQVKGSSLAGRPLGAIRPPIALAGGDFATDGRGTAFTSTETLRDNGGNVDLLDLSFRAYFGVEHIVYLYPLPGQTVKHIDMFFQPLNPNVLLLGEYTAQPSTAEERRLQSEASRVLQQNLRILTEHYRGRGHAVRVVRSAKEMSVSAVNIVLVPMPPVSRPLFQEEGPLMNEIELELSQLADLEQLTDAYQMFEERRKLFSEDDLETMQEILSDLTEARRLTRHDYNNLQALRQNLTLLAATAELMSNGAEAHADAVQELRAAVDSACARIQAVEATEGSNQLTGVVANLKEIAAQLQTVKAKLLQVGQRLEGENLKWKLTQLDNMAELEAALINLKNLRELYRSGTDHYRTYLNFLQVRTRDKNLLLLPSYSDPSLMALERKVYDLLKDVYQAAAENVFIIPVQSDTLIKQFGTVHCITRVVPEDVAVMDEVWLDPAGQALRAAEAR